MFGTESNYRKRCAEVTQKLFAEVTSFFCSQLPPRRGGGRTFKYEIENNQIRGTKGAEREQDA